MKNLLIYVKQLEKKPLVFSEMLDRDIVETGPGLPFLTEDILAAGTAELIGKTLLVKCKIKTAYNITCARCLDSIEKEFLTDDFLVNIEIINQDIIDLTGYIREDIILALPAVSLCKKNCKGLCPSCGINLNKSSCGCMEGGEKGGPWKKLDDLNIK
ncbi:DUF177 domain-containing protein [bacterium]|jgi:uncharacterized metal-binding protein YceD (DUF177 family)|nr:DUF177 domain-containing protein [bacterium]